MNIKTKQNCSAAIFLSNCQEEKIEVIDQLKSTQIIQELSNLQQLTLEVTDACNLNCKYCGFGSYYSGYDKRNDSYMSFPVAKNIIDYLRTFWKSKMSLSSERSVFISFYGGEPLLNMTLIKQVVDYTTGLCEDSISFIYSMTTNAMLLDKYMDYLIEKKFQLLVSLDGNDRSHSYRVTKGGSNSFCKVMTNLGALRSKFPDYFETNVNFNAVIHNRNSVEEVYKFFKREFGKRPMLSELNTAGIAPESHEEFLKTYRNFRESLNQAESYEELQDELFADSPDIRNLAVFLISNSGNVFQRYGDLLFERKNKRVLPTGTCIPFSRKLFVTVNGKILPCERISHLFALGNVTDNGVTLNIEEVAAQYNLYFAKLLALCKNCFNHNSCVQCIFNLESIVNIFPECYGFMDHAKFINYVEWIMKFLEKYPHYYKKILEEVHFY